MSEKCLNILGIRGIPAAHGGFETFAAHFAPFMRDMGWKVSVYCQEEEGDHQFARWEDEWEGIRRIHFATHFKGALATMEFDLRAVLDVVRQPGIDLVLGYNTAIFNTLQRLAGRRVVMNMDGIEWKRRKWSKLAKAWFWLNEWIGARVCHIPIADHPEIAAHLERRGCKNAVVIPYGSDEIESASPEILARFGLEARNYFISVSRIEPENSILEMIEAFIAADTGKKFIVLGKLDPERNPYHAEIKQTANDDVIFPGAIYDPEILKSLRFHALAYMHGHQVGGTNPSLVEALGAGNLVVAHDNMFNRWTAGGSQFYFKSSAECAAALKSCAELKAEDIKVRQELSLARHRATFQFAKIHNQYLSTILDCI